MTNPKQFDVIIIGGSYAGLSAAMALGRAIKNVLIIDGGEPCNRQTPHSHNFLTQDGKKPSEIAALAKEQVLQYPTIKFHSDMVTNAVKAEEGFCVQTWSGEKFAANKLIFATGINDLMPDVKGFSECWGISVIHCPYCHGYEVRNVKTGVLDNSPHTYEFVKMLSNWTKDLTLFTNGKSILTEEQTAQLSKHHIRIIETEIESFDHDKGNIREVVFKDQSRMEITAIYAKLPFEQHCDLPEKLGCELTELGHLKVDFMQKTTVEGVFACGDNSSMYRAISSAVFSGTVAGSVASRELIGEAFERI